MTQTDPFGQEHAAPATASGAQFSVDTLKQASLGAKVSLGGAVVTLIAYFLPWAKVSGFGMSESASASDAGASLVILGALVVAALVVVQLVKGAHKAMVIGGIVASIITLLKVVLEWTDIKDAAGAADGIEGISVSTGFGLWLALIASAAMVAGSVLSLKEMQDA
jgi:hypothetical protein